MKPTLEIAPSDALAASFLALFAAEQEKAFRRAGRFALALPGGSTAEAFLPRLAAAGIAWERVHVFWGDERCVPPGHRDSNYGLARRLLFDHVAHPAENVHRVAGEADPEAAARGYEADLARVLGDAPRLDLVLLGMGPDGHVCSLFPGHALLAERTSRVAAIHDSPKPPPARVTLTLRALAEAGVVCLAAFGEAKAEALRAALEDPASALPSAHVMRAARRGVILADPAAGRLLRR